MASTISAGTTSGTAIAIAGDTTGNLAFQTSAGTYTQTMPNATGTIMVSGNMPAFSTSTLYNITVSNATYTVATNYQSSTFDTASAFNSTTGKFQPTVAGYYQLNAVADFGTYGQGAASAILAVIFKNGSFYSSSGASASSTSYVGYLHSTIIYLNGSTDYAQAGIFQNGGGTTSNARALFNGAMIRAA
jgi:hypothetical protein